MSNLVNTPNPKMNDGSTKKQSHIPRSANSANDRGIGATSGSSGQENCGKTNGRSAIGKAATVWISRFRKIRYKHWQKTSMGPLNIKRSPTFNDSSVPANRSWLGGE
jgi:hypothetical protein